MNKKKTKCRYEHHLNIHTLILLSLACISKCPKYRFPSNIDLPKCRREMAASLNEFSNHWCKRENVEPDALTEWKIYIFKIIDTRISFYSCNTHLLPPKPKSSFRHLNDLSRIFI